MKEIEKIQDEVRDAIIEKWMTYIRVENSTDWLVWR